MSEQERAVGQTNVSPTSSKIDDHLFWYYNPQRMVIWGYRAEDGHEGREYETEEGAFAAYRRYVRSHPELSKEYCVLPKGSQVCVDFDGTIYPGRPGDTLANMKDPDPVCVRTLQQLHNAGYEITIFSCRANLAVIKDNMRAQVMMENMEAYLRKHGIPYDTINLTKPNYTVIIDDRALNATPRSWAQVRQALQMSELPELFSSQESPRDLNRHD